MLHNRARLIVDLESLLTDKMRDALQKRLLGRCAGWPAQSPSPCCTFPACTYGLCAHWLRAAAAAAADVHLGASCPAEVATATRQRAARVLHTLLCPLQTRACMCTALQPSNIAPRRACLGRKGGMH